MNPSASLKSGITPTDVIGPAVSGALMPGRGEGSRRIDLGNEIPRLLEDILIKDTAPDQAEIQRVRQICDGISDRVMSAQGLTREKAKAAVAEALGAMLDQISQRSTERPRSVQARVRSAYDALGIK